MCRWAKWAKKCQIVLVLPTQILKYYSVDERNKPKFLYSTDVLLCRQAKWAKKYEIILGLPSQILIYYCVGKQSKPTKL